MAQLVEKDDGSTVDGQLIPDEIEQLREMGVEVDEPDEQPDGSGGGGDGLESEEEEEDEQDESGGSGGGEEEEQEPDEESDEEQSGGSGGDEEESQEESGDKEEGSGSGDDGEEEEEGQDEDVELDNSGIDAGDLEQLEEESDIAGEEEVDSQEVDEQMEAVKMAGGGEGNIRVENFESADHPSEWERRASQYARQLGGMLVDHFRQERKTDVKRGQRSGRFDSGRLIQADRGSPKVFKSENKPDEKKYHCVICLDDSGSMDGEFQEAANISAGMLVQALEEVGIETTVYRFARDVRLVKSAAQEYSEVKDMILENGTNGGTRLLPAVEQADEIAKQHADETFLVTITDGCPSRQQDVKEKLEESSLRSISLQIMYEDDFFRGAYDGFVEVNDVGSIPSQTQSAFRRVML